MEKYPFYIDLNFSLQWIVRFWLGQSVVTTSASMEELARMTPASAVRGLEETTVCTPVSVCISTCILAICMHSVTLNITHSICACDVLLLLCV